MQAVKNNKKFAKKVNIPQSVGDEFAAADQGGSYQQLPERIPAGKKGKGGKMSSAAVKVKVGVVKKPVKGGKPAGKPAGKPKGK